MLRSSNACSSAAQRAGSVPYRQFDADSTTLPAFYVGRGFAVKAAGEGEHLSVFLGIPLAVHSGHTERLFTCWRR